MWRRSRLDHFEIRIARGRSGSIDNSDAERLECPLGVAAGRRKETALIPDFSIERDRRILIARGEPSRLGHIAVHRVITSAELLAQSLLDSGWANFRDDAPSFNRALIAAVKATEAAREPGEEVMLDRRLHGRQIGGGWRLDRAFEMGFTIRDIPFRGTDLHIDTIQAMLARRPSVLAVLDRDSVAQLPERFALSSVADVPLSPAETGSIQHGVYRIAMKG